MDDDVKGGEVLLQFFRESADRFTVLNVQNRRLHPWIRRDGLIEQVLAAACNDDLIALRVESLGEPAADTRASAGYEYCVATYFHDVSPVRRLNRRGVVNAKVIRKWINDPHRPRVMRSRSQGRRRSVDRGTCGPGIQPRKFLPPGGRRCRRKRKAPSGAPIS